MTDVRNGAAEEAADRGMRAVREKRARAAAERASAERNAWLETRARIEQDVADSRKQK